MRRSRLRNGALALLFVFLVTGLLHSTTFRQTLSRKSQAERVAFSCGFHSSEDCFKEVKVLVTGVAGFVGSHVADKIKQISKNIIIIGVDDLSAFGESQRVNIPKEVFFVKGDLTIDYFVQNLFKEHGKFHYVYHIAAYGGQGMSNFIRTSMYKKNTIASSNLVNAAVNFGTEHFVFISSCAVYGSSATAPLLESKSVYPDDPYGISKFGTELDIQAASKQFGLNYTIFRAHNLYGPRQFLNDPFRNVISIWLRQMLLHENITIFGSGEQTRSFTFIDDVSMMIAEAPFNYLARNKILNAGSVESTKLNDMLDEMARILMIKPNIHRLPVRRETSEVSPSHELQSKIFGKEQFTNFRVGLEKTIEWTRTLDWDKLGLAPHPAPEIKKKMPRIWYDLFESGVVAHQADHIYKEKKPENPAKHERRIGSHLTRNSCRFDGNQLITVIDFGPVPLANNFLPSNSSEKDFANELLYPLTVGFDPTCGSFQVNVMPLAQKNVWKDYIYYSSVIQSLSNEFVEYAREFSSLFDEPGKRKILEIGCNDGVFLKPLSSHGFEVIGVDPASNVVKALQGNYTIYDTFFGTQLAEEVLLQNHGKFDAIVTSNSFAHIDDMVDVMKGIKLLLQNDGILAIQIHYVVSMVEKMQYDWIYHEHLSYYSLYSISNFLSQFSMRVFDAKETSMHGGSLRLFVQNVNENRADTESLRKIRIKESELGVDKLSFFVDFEDKMHQTRLQIRKILAELVEFKKKVVMGYGAPARATTLSAYIGLDFIKKHLSAVIDDSEAKQGAYMPGTHLKIISSKVLREETRPDCIFLFAWPWVNDIVKKNQEFIQNGGMFIVPLPEVFVIDSLNFETIF